MFALLPVFAWGVCAFLVLARLLGVVGQCGCVRPFCPVCLLACSRSGVGLLACARLARAGWAEGGQVGAGQSCPAPLRALVALSTARCVARKERRVGGAPRGVLTRAHTRREEGRGRGASWGGPWWSGWGLWVVARWVVTRVGGDKCPKPGESKIATTGAGAWCAPGRGGSFGGGCAWWLRVLVGALLPLGARGGAGGVALSSWWWAWVGGGGLRW